MVIKRLKLLASVQNLNLPAIDDIDNIDKNGLSKCSANKMSIRKSEKKEGRNDADIGIVARSMSTD